MARAALKVVAPEPTFAELMEALSKNYAAQRPYKVKLDELETEAKELKALALPLMDAQGVRKTSTKTATISLVEREGVIIDDVTTMLRALKRDGYEHCITLKVASAKEYAEKRGKDIPGTHTEVVTRFIQLSGIK